MKLRLQSYNGLTEEEYQEYLVVGESWPKWAIRNIGANGDYSCGLTLQQDEDMWVIVYLGNITPFRAKSRSVVAELIYQAQRGLSKL